MLLHAPRRVLATLDLGLRNAVREQRRRVVDEPPRVGLRYLHERLLKTHRAADRVGVDRRPRQGVLLSAVRDRSEPWWPLRRAQPLADERFAGLVRVDVAAAVAEMREQTQVDALLPGGRRRMVRRRRPRARPRAWLADMRRTRPPRLVLVGEVAPAECLGGDTMCNGAAAQPTSACCCL